MDRNLFVGGTEQTAITGQTIITDETESEYIDSGRCFIIIISSSSSISIIIS